MKNQIGTYYRLTSKKEFDNLGFKNKFDIIIIFNKGFEMTKDIEDTLGIMLEGNSGLGGLAQEKPFATKEKVEERIRLVLTLLDYISDVDRIYVEQSVNFF